MSDSNICHGCSIEGVLGNGYGLRWLLLGCIVLLLPGIVDISLLKSLLQPSIKATGHQVPDSVLLCQTL